MRHKQWININNELYARLVCHQRVLRSQIISVGTK